MDKALIEIGAFPVKTVIAIHFAVIAHKDHNGVVPLAGFLEILHQPTELIVNQLDFRVVVPEMLSFSYSVNSP